MKFARLLIFFIFFRAFFIHNKLLSWSFWLKSTKLPVFGGNFHVLIFGSVMSLAGIVTTLRCGQDIVESWVLYHLHLGFDRLFLFFDEPSEADEWSNFFNEKVGFRHRIC